MASVSFVGGFDTSEYVGTCIRRLELRESLALGINRGLNSVELCGKTRETSRA